MTSIVAPLIKLTLTLCTSLEFWCVHPVCKFSVFDRERVLSTISIQNSIGNTV